MQKLFHLLTTACLTSLPMTTHAQTERVELTLSDSSSLAVYRMLPSSLPADGAPLVILMPGGSGDESLARDLHFWLGEELRGAAGPWQCRCRPMDGRFAVTTTH